MISSTSYLVQTHVLTCPLSDAFLHSFPPPPADADDPLAFPAVTPPRLTRRLPQTERRASSGTGSRRLLTAEEKIQLELKVMKEREDELRCVRRISARAAGATLLERRVKR